MEGGWEISVVDVDGAAGTLSLTPGILSGFSPPYSQDGAELSLNVISITSLQNFSKSFVIFSISLIG
jgi:hypothetical protein